MMIKKGFQMEAGTVDTIESFQRPCSPSSKKMQLAAQIVDVGLFLASGQMLCTQAIAHQSHTVPLHTITVIVYSILKIIDCRYHGMTTFHMRDLCHASCHADNPMICLRKVTEFCDIFMNLYESLRLCKNL